MPRHLVGGESCGTAAPSTMCVCVCVRVWVWVGVHASRCSRRSYVDGHMIGIGGALSGIARLISCIP